MIVTFLYSMAKVRFFPDFSHSCKLKSVYNRKITRHRNCFYLLKRRKFVRFVYYFLWEL